MSVPQEALGDLERRVVAAFARGDEQDLEVLGYGEISSVLKLRAGGSIWAAKRLPPFSDRAAFESYRACFEAYLQELARRGVRPLPSELHALPTGGGRVVAWCLQPLLSSDALLVQRCRALSVDEAAGLVDRVIAHALATIDDRLGLDAQLSNWALCEGELVYLDVTTPLLRDESGRERLDLDLFLASLPWLLRGVVRRFLLAEILATYYDPRRAVRDLLCNLFKERLEPLLAPALAAANRRLKQPLDERELRRSYAADARMWGVLQRLRRADRAWQLRVRRRPYPFLLPGRIER